MGRSEFDVSEAVCADYQSTKAEENKLRPPKRRIISCHRPDPRKKIQYPRIAITLNVGFLSKKRL